MARLVNEKRGAVTVQIALFLPILIIILVGAFEVWKIMYLQQVLNDAAYQGVRLLVTQANAPAVQGRKMENEAAALIRRYVSNQAFSPIPDLTADEPDEGDEAPPLQIDDAYYRDNPELEEIIVVSIIPDPYDHWPPICGEVVVVSVSRPWIVGRGLRANRSGWMTFLEDEGRLYGQAAGVVQCEREEDVLGGP